MEISLEDRETLSRMLEVESRMDEPHLRIGWSWQDVATWPATINSLIVKKLVSVALSTNSGTGYRVTEEGKLAAVAEIHPVQTEPELIDDFNLFSGIVGYDNIKELMKTSLALDKPVHILLYGPPAIAKSMFLWEIERVYGNQCLPFIGSATSHAGMWDMLIERHPRIILIDELEKMNITDTAGLLSLMEYGRVIRAKVGRSMDVKSTAWVFATANRITSIPPELLSRFAKQELKEYSDQEFIIVVKNVLQKNEELDEDSAAMVAEKLVGRTHDIRDAVRVARMSKKTGVIRAIELLNLTKTMAIA
jgi:Holliday junction DNA helicase RuvB